MENVATIKTLASLTNEQLILLASGTKREECRHHTNKFLCAYCCKWYDLFTDTPSKPIMIPGGNVSK